MTFDDPSPWLAVFGRAHVVLLHAPLGMLPAIALLEFGAAALRRPPVRGPVLALAWLCALASAAAAAAGLVLAGEGGHDEGTLSWHKIAGIVLASLCVVIAATAFFGNRLPLRLSLLAALGAMVPAGHFGGTMTHGKDFLWEPLRKKPAVAPAPPPANGTTPANGTPPPAASEFERTIRPILERCCTKCHNAEKQKGELLLTTTEGIQKGGKNGAVVVAGKPDESPMVVRCELPLDDDDHMPPEGKPQPTAQDVAALRAWVLAGAKF